MNRKIFIISIIVIILDQVLKTIVTGVMDLNESIVIVNNFFSFTYFHNYGAAWGIFKDRTILLIIATLVALGFIYRYMHSFKENKKNNIAFGLLTGGIIGNLIDRIFYGYVVDFFDFYIFGYDFPIFNISDMAIVIGVILLIVAIIRGEDSGEKKDNSK